MSGWIANGIDTDEAARLLGVSRDTLDRMYREAPELPGAPVNVGKLEGRRRKLQWNRELLSGWFAAYGAWRASQRPAVKTPAVRRPRHAAPARTSGRGRLTMAELNLRER